MLWFFVIGILWGQTVIDPGEIKQIFVYASQAECIEHRAQYRQKHAKVFEKPFSLLDDTLRIVLSPCQELTFTEKEHTP